MLNSRAEFMLSPGFGLLHTLWAGFSIFYRSISYLYASTVTILPEISSMQPDGVGCCWEQGANPRLVLTTVVAEFSEYAMQNKVNSLLLTVQSRPDLSCPVTCPNFQLFFSKFAKFGKLDKYRSPSERLPSSSVPDSCRGKLKLQTRLLDGSVETFRVGSRVSFSFWLYGCRLDPMAD